MTPKFKNKFRTYLMVELDLDYDKAGNHVAFIEKARKVIFANSVLNKLIERLHNFSLYAPAHYEEAMKVITFLESRKLPVTKINSVLDDL